MFNTNKPEVLVVGAGPVGLLTALCLTRRGIRVRLVDKDSGTAAHSYGLALHSKSMQVLQRLNLLEPVLAIATPIDLLSIYDARSRRLELGLPPGATPFVTVVRQDILEGVLIHELEKLGVKVQWMHRLAELDPSPGAMQVSLDHLEKMSVGYPFAATELLTRKREHIEVQFVIGADGSLSNVRQAQDIAFTEVGPLMEFAVFQFKSTADMQRRLQLMFAGDLLSVAWPLPDDYSRWSFQLPASDSRTHERRKSRQPIERGATDDPELSDDALLNFLKERAPWFDGEVLEINWRAVVPFQRGMAESFGCGSVWLAGDAGHMTSPAGIQSMNVGLREAEDLAIALEAVLRDGQPPARLERYGAERRREWRELLGLSGAPVPEPGCDPWIAERAASLIPSLPASGEDLRLLAHRLGLSLGEAQAKAV